MKTIKKALINFVLGLVLADLLKEQSGINDFFNDKHDASIANPPLKLSDEELQQEANVRLGIELKINALKEISKTYQKK